MWQRSIRGRPRTNHQEGCRQRVNKPFGQNARDGPKEIPEQLLIGRLFASSFNTRSRRTACGIFGRGRSAWCERRADERVQLVLRRQAGPWRVRCGMRWRRSRTTRATDRGVQHGRSCRFTKPGSCCSTTTRGLLFATSFDGSWDAYMDDFFTQARRCSCSMPMFRHVEGYEGLPDIAAVKALSGAQDTAAAYARNYGGTVKEIRKALRVNAAFQQVLDDPAAAERAAASGVEAAARRGRATKPRAETRKADDVGSHLRAAGVGRADRGHHRRVRVSESRAARRISCWCMNTLPFAPPIGARSPTGSSIASGCGRCRRERPQDEAPFAVHGGEEIVIRLRVLAERRARTLQEGTCATPGGRHGRIQCGRRARRPAHGVRVFAGPALGSVHHGCAGSAEDDRDRASSRSPSPARSTSTARTS